MNTINVTCWSSVDAVIILYPFFFIKIAWFNSLLVMQRYFSVFATAFCLFVNLFIYFKSKNCLVLDGRCGLKLPITK
jgi:hypothetical protein